jgi:hypothetical protein
LTTCGNQNLRAKEKRSGEAQYTLPATTPRNAGAIQQRMLSRFDWG